MKKFLKIVAIIGLILVVIPFIVNGITYYNLQSRKLSADSVYKKYFYCKYSKSLIQYEKYRKFSVVEIEIGKYDKFFVKVMSIIQRDYEDISFFGLYKGITIYQKWAIGNLDYGISFTVINLYTRF